VPEFADHNGSGTVAGFNLVRPKQQLTGEITFHMGLGTINANSMFRRPTTNQVEFLSCFAVILGATVPPHAVFEIADDGFYDRNLVALAQAEE
jgi:hypothetical protein